MKRTGEILQKAREEKDLSLHEIALSLKINSKVLSAIESGDLEKLPAKTFLRGFVQSYANYLKIDTDHVMSVFAEEMGKTRPSPLIEGAEETPGEDNQPVIPEESPLSREEPVFQEISKQNNLKLFIVTGLCLILVTLILITAKIVDRYKKETITEEVQVTSPLPESSPVEAPASTAAAPEDKEEKEAEKPADPPKETAETKPVDEKPTLPVKTAPPITTPLVTAPAATIPAETSAEKPQTPPTAAAPVAPVAVPAAKPATTPTPPPAADKKPAGRQLEMIVETLDQVELEYGTSTGALRKVQLGPDRVHTIRSRDGLRLNISNGGAVNLNLNGRDLGVPGDLGKPVQLTY